MPPLAFPEFEPFWGLLCRRMRACRARGTELLGFVFNCPGQSRRIERFSNIARCRYLCYFGLDSCSREAVGGSGLHSGRILKARIDQGHLPEAQVYNLTPGLYCEPLIWRRYIHVRNPGPISTPNKEATELPAMRLLWEGRGC